MKAAWCCHGNVHERNNKKCNVLVVIVLLEYHGSNQEEMGQVV